MNTLLYTPVCMRTCCRYVLEVPPATVPIAVAAYLVANVLAVPLWLRLGRRYGKVRAFRASMWLNAVGYVPMVPIVMLPHVLARLSIVQRLVYACFCAGVIGVGANARLNLAESIAGDIIDEDQLVTGERKQGVFFSLWMFMQKSAGGGVTLTTGVLLATSGFVPNQPQALPTKLAIAAMFALVPALAMGFAAHIFSEFSLDEQAHARVRTGLTQRVKEDAVVLM